jgi:hypothetical protein
MAVNCSTSCSAVGRLEGLASRHCRISSRASWGHSWGTLHRSRVPEHSRVRRQLHGLCVQEWRLPAEFASAAGWKLT